VTATLGVNVRLDDPETVRQLAALLDTRRAADPLVIRRGLLRDEPTNMALAWKIHSESPRAQLALRLFGPSIHAGWAAGRIDDSTVAELTPLMFEMAERPEDSLSTTAWIALWEVAGFTVNGYPAPRPPTDDLVVWRGATEDTRRNTTWTLDLKHAVQAANDRPGGVV
jgi:hypothetical protein